MTIEATITLSSDDVRGGGLEAFDGLVAVADGDDLHVLVGERQLNHALDRDAVVGQEQSMRHLVGIGRKNGLL